MKTYQLSKSRILSGIQCPKRLFLEIHKPHLIDSHSGDDYRMNIGQQVTEIARDLFPGGKLISLSDGYEHALKVTEEYLKEYPTAPLFEASFKFDGTFIRSDLFSKLDDGYCICEVKSATSVKGYYYPDCAVQAWVIEKCGYVLSKVEIAVIDNSFVYPGDLNYHGLFSYVDITDEILTVKKEIPDIINALKSMLQGTEPGIEPGNQCNDPFACPFSEYCSPSQRDYPISCLPRGGKIVEELHQEGIKDIRDIPEGRLTNPTHEKVRRVTIKNSAEINPAFQKKLNELEYPRYYLDFETIQFAIPIWKGTRPYQQLPFQWSCHIENEPGEFEHQEFLDLSGDDPTKAFTERLIHCLGESGPIIVYSSFEQTQLNNMARMYPDLEPKISALIERLVDLLPMTRQFYYHPQMKGSWSIKAVLPTVAPDLDYSKLEEIKDGTGAQVAFLEAIQPETTRDRKNEIESRLLEYCTLDTLAMVRIVEYFA
jgi:hypothetical protein